MLRRRLDRSAGRRAPCIIVSCHFVLVFGNSSFIAVLAVATFSFGVFELSHSRARLASVLEATKLLSKTSTFPVTEYEPSERLKRVAECALFIRNFIRRLLRRPLITPLWYHADRSNRRKLITPFAVATFVDRPIIYTPYKPIDEDPGNMFEVFHELGHLPDSSRRHQVHFTTVALEHMTFGILATCLCFRAKHGYWIAIPWLAIAWWGLGYSSGGWHQLREWAADRFAIAHLLDEFPVDVVRRTLRVKLMPIAKVGINVWYGKMRLQKIDECITSLMDPHNAFRSKFGTDRDSVTHGWFGIIIAMTAVITGAFVVIGRTLSWYMFLVGVSFTVRAFYIHAVKSKTAQEAEVHWRRRCFVEGPVDARSHEAD